MEVVYLESTEKLAHKTIVERFVAVARSKNASPTWSDVRVALLHFDRAGLLRLHRIGTQRLQRIESGPTSTSSADWLIAAIGPTAECAPIPEGSPERYVRTELVVRSKVSQLQPQPCAG